MHSTSYLGLDWLKRALKRNIDFEPIFFFSLVYHFVKNGGVVRNSIKAINLINKKEIVVFGIPRSGTHAIIHWLISHHGPRVVHLDNIQTSQPYAGCGSITCKGLSVWKTKPDLKHLWLRFQRHPITYDARDELVNLGYIRSISPKNCLILSYENEFATSDIFTTFQHNHDLEVGCSETSYQAAILRDAYNLFASQLASPFFTPDIILASIQAYKRLARLFLDAEKQKQLKIRCINFNKWVAEPAYRIELATHFNFITYGTPYLRVSKIGYGSSFEGTLKNNRAMEMKVSERWKYFITHPAYHVIFQDQELVELTAEIFGEILPPEIFKQNNKFFDLKHADKQTEQIIKAKSSIKTWRREFLRNMIVLVKLSLTGLLGHRFKHHFAYNRREWRYRSLRTRFSQLFIHHQRQRFETILAGQQYQFTKSQFDPNDFILDIGARFGLFSNLCYLHGSRQIHCLPTDSLSFTRIMETLTGLSGIFINKPSTNQLNFGSVDKLISQIDDVLVLRVNLDLDQIQSFLAIKSLGRAHQIIGEFYQSDKLKSEQILAELTTENVSIDHSSSLKKSHLIDALKMIGFRVNLIRDEPHGFIIDAIKNE